MTALAEKRVTERPFGPFERMLAMRYLGAKREHGGLAFISVVSVIGITLGVWALILTMSIMNGFRLELISKIVGFEPHVFIDTRGAPASSIETLMANLRSRPGVDAVEPMHEGFGLASAYGRSQGIEIRGVRPEDLRKNALVSGSIAEGQRAMANPNEPWPRAPLGQGSLDRFGDEGALSKDIVLGSSFAYSLGVGVGDKVKVTQPDGPSTPAGRSPRSITYTVAAIYHAGNDRYDRLMGFLPIEASKNLFGYNDGYPIVGVRLSDPNAANKFAESIAGEVPYRVQSWIQRSSTYVTALEVERNVMRLILFIVVVITALNIITGVLMLVKNKARDIAILRTIGATRAGVVRIFMMTGTVLGMVGVGTGVLLGVLCAIYIAPIQHFLEWVFNVELFPADIYQLDSLPAKLEWGEVAWVGAMAFVVTLFMSIIPSMWAARLNPVEALRFE
jgi:lipoprotein-releasing system permease protein